MKIWIELSENCLLDKHWVSSNNEYLPNSGFSVKAFELRLTCRYVYQ